MGDLFHEIPLGEYIESKDETVSTGHYHRRCAGVVQECAAGERGGAAAESEALDDTIAVAVCPRSPLGEECGGGSRRREKMGLVWT